MTDKTEIDMRYIKFLTPFILALAWTSPAFAWHGGDDTVSVEILGEYGRSLPRYPQSRDSDRDVTRAYIEAVPEASYSIRVRNNSPERIGLVIAVDGRNIISGKKSHLKRKEKMYVLGPWQSASYKGWRTGKNRINEFFFTREIDSYAGAFGDYSAMGVVAVAAFRDRSYRPPRYYDDQRRYREEADDTSRERSSKHGSAPRPGMRSESAQEAAPGTGFGDERWSPSVRVDFDAERKPSQRVFLKYEWRDTLCEMGISRCHAKRHNRFWKDPRYSDRGFAAYPPGYRRPARDRSVSYYRRYR